MKYIGTYSEPQDIATKANVDAVADAVAKIKADYAQTTGGNTLGAHKIVNTDANGKLIGTDGTENAMVKYNPANGLETSNHVFSDDGQTVISYIDEENNTGLEGVFKQDSIEFHDANGHPCFMLNEQILGLAGNQGTLIGIPGNRIQINGGRINIGETGEGETSKVTIKNVVTPTDNSDAVPKSYVDNLVAQAGDVDTLLLKGSKASLPSSSQWNTVCYGNDKYVAGADGKLAYSTDGLTWTQVSLPSAVSVKEVESICYGGDKFVAVLSVSNMALYSTDGVAWNTTSMPVNASWSSVCYGSGKFVAVNHNGSNAAYSTDGITWTRTTLTFTGFLHSVCYSGYSGGRFIAVGNSRDVAYSTDGITWQRTYNALPVNTGWRSVCYGSDASKFVAVASNNIAYSTDGATWTSATLPVSAGFRSIGYSTDNRRFVVVAYGSSVALVSVDGINWSQVVMPTSAYWTSVCYGNGKYLAVAYNNNVVAYSTNGLNWAVSDQAIRLPDNTDVTSDVAEVLGVSKKQNKLSGRVGQVVGFNSAGNATPVTLTASDVGALPSDTTYVSSVDGESGAVTTNAVKTTAQTLTDAQKSQARTNIGAGTSSFSGNYNDLANKPSIPSKTSEIDNDSGYITSAGAPVQSVNSKTGAVTLSASDVGALPDTTVIPTIPDNLVQYTAISAVQDVDTLNADTLEGHSASYFATATGLSSTNAQVTTNTNNISTLDSGLSTANGNITTLQNNKLNKSGGTMTGALVAQSNTNYTTAQVRNVIISTADPSGGSNGMIWIKYTP